MTVKPHSSNILIFPHLPQNITALIFSHRLAKMKKAQQEVMEEKAAAAAAVAAAAAAAAAERAQALVNATDRARAKLAEENKLSRKSRGKDLTAYIRRQGWDNADHPNYISSTKPSEQWTKILEFRGKEEFIAEAKRTGNASYLQDLPTNSFDNNKVSAGNSSDTTAPQKQSSRAAAYVIQEHPSTDDDHDDNSDDSDVNEKEVVTTSVIDFGTIVDRCWLAFFLIISWAPVLACTGYVCTFILPSIATEIRSLTIPTHFVLDVSTEDSIIDYRNIHKGEISHKTPTYEQLVADQHYKGDAWERVWKHGARQVGVEIEMPFPRGLGALFAILADFWAAYALCRQIRVDELLRPCTRYLNLPQFLQARPKFVLSLYHHSGELMDIQSTLMKDHLIFDDLPRDGPAVDFGRKYNERIGAIQLRRIRSAIGVTPSFAMWCGAACVWASIPWGMFTLIFADSRGTWLRVPGITCGIMICIRTLGGPLAFLEGFMLFQAFTSMNAFRYWTLSTHMGKSYCVKGGLLCSGIGILTGTVILATFQLTTEFGWEKSRIGFGQLWVPMLAVSCGCFLLLGFVFGCRRNLPTNYIPILTSLGRGGRPGTLIQFSQIARCACVPQQLRELCIQETSLLVFMEDARELDHWIKCQYLIN